METLTVIRNLDQLEELTEYLKDKDVIAFDTEATGLSIDDEIIGFSICADPEEAFYVVMAEWNVEKQLLIQTPISQASRKIIELLKDKQLVMHNATFDCQLVRRCCDVDLMPSLAVDTLMLGHLLDENRSNALKSLGATIFGADSKDEQVAMAASVKANGGKVKITKGKMDIEIYKADSQLIAKYGAKDAILTYKLMVLFLDQLKDNQDLWKFYFEDESMPLLKGPTYSLNSAGLKVDNKKLEALEIDLKYEMKRLEQSIQLAIKDYIKEVYPGTSKKNTFNIGSNNHLAWLLYIRLGQEFKNLTDGGKVMAKKYIGKIPYGISEKRRFIDSCKKDGVKYEKLLSVDKFALQALETKFSWIADLLEYSRLKKLLKTYVDGIKARMKYNVIRPGFLQHGTTSGRYSSSNPNFQNLPRDDKRVKACIIPRPGKVFVGADYSQLEPRVFASFSQDFELLKCFEREEDFYSVIGKSVFNKPDASGYKDDPNGFAKIYKSLRQISKAIALSVTYGTTSYKMRHTVKGADGQDLSIDECQKIIDDYFEAFPGVKRFMDESHAMAVKSGQALSLYGRPRRIPEAKQLQRYGNFNHAKLPYELRNHLNLSVNHRVQSTGASIINRAAIALCKKLKDANIDGELVMQVHDELIVECAKDQADQVAAMMKDAMENTVSIPGVKLVADPIIGMSLAEIKGE